MNAMPSSKALVRSVFESGSLPRLPYIPWVFTHAARLEQVPLRRMYADPTQYVKCLQNARKLYGYDAVISGFDASLEAELCGCRLTWAGDYEAPAAGQLPGLDIKHLQNIDIEALSSSGRLGTVMESLRRIATVSGQSLAMAIVVTGPLTLAGTLLGKDIAWELARGAVGVEKAVETTAAFLLRLVQAYGELEPDMVVVADRLLPSLPAERRPWLESALSPLVNTVRFFNAFSVLLPGEINTEELSGLLDLGFDGVAAGGIDAAAWQDIRAGRPCVLGHAIPSRLLLSGGPELQDYIDKYLPGKDETGVFLTTDWEIPDAAPADVVRSLMKMVS
jgi:uroporphyrinogen-III decarboxylase